MGGGSIGASATHLHATHPPLHTHLPPTLPHPCQRTGPADPTPKLRACTPRRGAYFADLRDEALAAHGAQSKLVKPFGYPIGFMGNDHYGCSIAGEYFSVSTAQRSAAWVKNVHIFEPLHARPRCTLPGNLHGDHCPVSCNVLINPQFSNSCWHGPPAVPRSSAV